MPSAGRIDSMVCDETTDTTSVPSARTARFSTNVPTGHVMIVFAGTLSCGAASCGGGAMGMPLASSFMRPSLLGAWVQNPARSSLETCSKPHVVVDRIG